LRDDAQTKLNTLETEKAALESQLNDETGALGKKAIENKIAEIDALRQEWMDKKKALSGHQKTIDLWENAAKSDKKIAALLQIRQDFIADQATLAKLAENPSYYDMITQDANGVYKITKTGDDAVLKGIQARMMGVKKSETTPKAVKGYL
jgi:DNA repair exonuclease SbcCD ATPase subunit